MGKPKTQEPNCIICKRKGTHCKDRCIRCYSKLIRQQRVDSAPLKKCECDPECQEMIPSIQLNGNIRRFAKGHGRSGENHSGWKGGKVKLGDYELIWVPDHPQANKKGYVLKHRLIYENYYNCCLLPWIEIHHIIPIKDGGTNDIYNLQPVTKSEHTSIHNPREDISNRYCLLCKTKTTKIDKKGYSCWYRNPITQEEFICYNCYIKIYRSLDKPKKRNYNMKKDLGDRFCILCKSETTRKDQYGYDVWLSDPITKLKWLCKPCFDYRKLSLRRKKK